MFLTGNPGDQELQIPADYPGTVQTIAHMRDLVKTALRDRRIVEQAQLIVAGLPRRDYHAEAATVLRWMQTNVRYVRDPWHPAGLERLQRPTYLLFENPARSGDCDDLAMAYCALVGAIGAPWAFRTAGQDPIFTRRFAHVFSLVNVPTGTPGGAWLAADPSFEHALGWEPGDNEPRLAGPSLAIRPGVVTARQDWPA